jgi:hypothetical protein
VLENLTSMVDVASVTTEHEVRLTGLSADTTYFYAIGSTTQIPAGDDTHYFVTAPNPGTENPVRVWVIGDSGTGNSNAAAVRDAYLGFNGNAYTDAWLMLGDNAYSDGTDSEYQDAVFDMYPTLLRQTVLWPTLGNHDGHSANSDTQTGPYYDIFTLPRSAEAGGLASGTEAYYSFDYANIHFICLDSHDSDLSPSGPMLTWLQNDLAATTQKWIIAYWHHPPYSKGSHDSDGSSRLTTMRENVLPILESYGVDLVMSGHSHSYERSYQVHGHYGTSGTLTNDMLVDSGDGRTDGDGAYTKEATGAVYVVAGSSGKTGGGSLNHPVMFFSISQLGSMVLDIDGDQLNATFVNDNGFIEDYLTMVKAPQGNQAPSVDAGGDQTIILPATASLDGTVSDDGLPDPPATVTTLWTEVSTPLSGTVTFGNASAVDTTATFSVDGTYVLRLTADDGEFAVSDEVTITVYPVGTTNQPPEVNAGLDDRITLSESATLNGTIDDDGLPNPPATFTASWSQVSGPGTVTFADADAVNTTASFSTDGTYVLRLTGNDSELTASDDVTIIVDPPAPFLDIRVAASSDDAEESSSGSVGLTSSDLELIQESSNQTVGMRFNGVAIPPGATIVLATIQFMVDETNSGATSLTIQAEAADNASTFTSSSGNVSSRVRTAASVGWSPPPWNTVGAEGPDQQTPNLAAVIQEVIDRQGWVSGNSLVLIITGTGKRVADSFNGNQAGAPLLHLEFTTGPPVNTAPAVNAGTDQTVTLPDSATLDGTVTDDGLPNSPGAVTTTWSKVSGPGTVSFADASAADTTASFSTNSIYVLRLTADDGEYSASDEVTITINPEPQNQAPIVDAGADQTITLPGDATLDGTVTDDGLPSPPALTTTWSQVSGPGTVTFTDTSAVDTTVSFETDGTYILRLTAADSEFTTSSDVTITVNPIPPNQAPTVAAGADQTITLSASATLDGTVTDDGLPNPPGAVTTTWSQVSGPGTVTFADASAVDTTASFSTNSTYVLRLTADDGALSTSSDVTITVNPAPQGLNIRVAASSDDAEESSSGSLKLTSSDLELIQESSNQTVGMRFNGVTIPVGATVTLASIQFQVDEATSGATTLTVQGEAADNPPTFSSSANVTSRARTAASMAWSPPPWNTVGEQGPDQQTPNLAAVIQEVVNRPGWASGNSLVVIITGTGKRVAESFNGVSNAAPLLHLEYYTGPPVNTAPAVTAGADQTVTLPDTATLNGTVTDDGLPDPPGAVTTTWSQVSGPGTVTFGDASAVDTTASFSTNSTYVLRLTAVDGTLSTSSDVTITVNPAPVNQAPSVGAGADQTITLTAR